MYVSLTFPTSCPAIVNKITFAPRAIVSWMLEIVLAAIFGWVATAITKLPCSIKAIGPCFNSPAIYASAWT